MTKKIMSSKGCAYGQVSRQMIVDMKDDIKETKDGISRLNFELTNPKSGLNLKLDDLFNHQSKRIPPWILAVGSIGGVVLGGLIVFF
jgi:hypothetical protein